MSDELRGPKGEGRKRKETHRPAFEGPIREWPSEERPRERLARLGPGALSEAQLLAILLRTGDASAGASALGLAMRLLADFGSLEELERASVAEISKTPGIGFAKAVQVKAALELGRRLMRGVGEEAPAFGSSREVAAYLVPSLAPKSQEEFHILLLNAKNRLLKELTVTRGTLTQSLVHPREVFAPAIRESAAFIVCAHNHPSGDPSPSDDDRALTRRLAEAGRLIGIPLLDHIIVGAGNHYSFADAGELGR
ncbi:MAG: DNA repair protein RadC [Nitrospinota bacterium]